MQVLKSVLLLIFVSYSLCNFVDVTNQVGLGNIEQQPIPMEDCLFERCVPMGMSGGVAVGDYNNDGLQDLIVTTIFDKDILYRNNGDGTFSDVTMSAGLGMTANHRSNGVLWCDIDNDNDVDLFVTTIANENINPEANRFYLYVNNGDGTFSEEAIERGVAQNDNESKYGTSATCGDFNNDGWLDLHVNQWHGSLISDIDTSHTKLYRNRGNGRFQDVTNQHDFADYDNAEFNFASAFVDMDKDGDQDLLISGDFKTSQYYRNDNGLFVDITRQSRCCGEDNGMGITFGDIDRNGYLDWYITSIGTTGSSTQTGNRLYLNHGNNVLEDATDDSDVRYADWGWGALLFDMDNDSDLDLMCTNGQWTNEDKFMVDQTRLWENTNGDGDNMQQRNDEYGIVDTGVGKSVVYFDYDLDGDLDIVISQTGPGIILYENRFNNNNDYLRVKTRGSKSNSYGIGAQITVWITKNSAPLYQEMGAHSHFLGHSEQVAHFGLGSGSGDVYEVEVYFPASRTTVKRTNVNRNSVITISENEGSQNNDDDDDSSNSSSSNGSSSSSSILLPTLFVCLSFLLAC